MEINQFIEQFAAQLDETDASEITTDTKFKDLCEWSSLLSLSIIAMVNEEYNAEINGKDIRDSKTINDLFEVVKSRIQGL